MMMASAFSGSPSHGHSHTSWLCLWRMSIRGPSLLALAGLLSPVALPGCGDPPPEGPPVGGPSMAELEADFELLESSRVYFNHHSVGDNILEGLKRLRPSLPLARGDGPEPGPLDGKGILHTRLGENGRPVSKLEGIAEMLGRMP